jgi:twitching motility two-component system response regulator PilH
MLSAFTGLGAIEVASAELPQIIVIDIMMPEMDGLSAVREIKREEATREIPVIVMTSNPQYRLSQQESQWAGATEFLTKPFGPHILISAIQRLAPLPEPKNDAKKQQ